MEKKLLCLITCLLMAGGVSGQLTATVPDIEALPGETVSFSLSFSGGQADTYTSLQFAIGVPAGITTSGLPTFSSSWPGATGSVGTNAALASAEPMQGTGIDNLVTISLKVDESIAMGAYDVTLSNIQFRYGTQGQHDDAPDVTFKVKVVSNHSVVLDEESTVAPVEASNVNVTVKRTINANSWSTICLPFAMTEAQCKAAFGNDVQLGDFKGYKYDVATDNIKVNFEGVTAMEANHPYIICVSTSLTQFAVDGVVDISPVDKPQVSFGYYSSGKKPTYYYPNDFNGTYVADFDFYNDATSYPLFLSGNKFYYATANTKHMKAFRAYFDFDDYLSEANAGSRIMLYFNDSEVTGISYAVLREQLTNDYVYDLQGRRLNALSKGLYIQQGKKVIIK